MIEKLHNKESFGIIYITVLTVVALVWGFSIIPSRQSEQSLVYDHKRIIDLGEINDTISDYYQNNNYLPQTLGQLTTNSDDATSPLNKFDPQTKAPYGYIVVDQTDYKLCAGFSSNSANDDPGAYDDANGDYDNFISQFAHPAGYYCFSENVSANSASVSPSPTCLGDCGTTPTPTPSPVIIYRSPCGPPYRTEGISGNIACPMIPGNPSHVIYNGNAAEETPTTSPVGGGGGGAN
jgi:hypothetical protein